MYHHLLNTNCDYLKRVIQRSLRNQSELWSVLWASTFLPQSCNYYQNPPRNTSNGYNYIKSRRWTCSFHISFSNLISSRFRWYHQFRSTSFEICGCSRSSLWEGWRNQSPSYDTGEDHAFASRSDCSPRRESRRYGCRCHCCSCKSMSRHFFKYTTML